MQPRPNVSKRQNSWTLVPSVKPNKYTDQLSRNQLMLYGIAMPKKWQVRLRTQPRGFVCGLDHGLEIDVPSSTKKLK